VYFFYFATVGAFSPYFSLYLQSLAFSPRQIGEFTAVLLGTKMLAPYVWGWLADLTGKRLGVARWAGLLAALGFAAVALARTYPSLMLALFVYSFFWNAGLPKFEAATMDHLRGLTHRYGRIRLWGSVGFILAASVLGPLLQGGGMRWFPVAVLILLSAMWLAMLGLREPTVVRSKLDTELDSVAAVLLQPAVIFLLLGGFLMQASHGAYYAFFSIYAADLGYGRSAVGLLWSIGVLAEIGVFLGMPRWLPNFGAVRLFQVSLLLATLRWLLIAFVADHPVMLIFAQLLHAATFGLFHASAIELVHRHFPAALRGRGQALYSSLSFGAGGALGSLAAGYLWKAWPGHWIFALSAFIAGLGFLLALAGMKKEAGTVLAS
jgi:PPP family 3-phenylpropionic acid transporter